MSDRVHEYPALMLHMVAFAIINHCIVMLAVQSTVPGNSHFLPLLVLLMISKSNCYGSLALALIYKSFKDPVKTFVSALAIGLWMFTLQQMSTDYLIVFCLLPVVFTSLLLTLVRFHVIRQKKLDSTEAENKEDEKKKTSRENSEETTSPDHLENKDEPEADQKYQTSKNSTKENNELIVTGVGCIDSRLNIFVAGNRFRALMSHLMKDVTIVNPEITKLYSIAIEDVDVHWPYLEALLQPGTKNGTLSAFSMVNNRAFSDQDAPRLCELIQDNESLENISITFDYQKTLVEKLFYFLFWDNCTPQLTTKGVHTILTRLIKMKSPPAKFLDFYGIHLDEETIKVAKNLSERKGIKVFGSKPDLKPETMPAILFSRPLQFACGVMVSAVSIFLVVVSVIWN